MKLFEYQAQKLLTKYNIPNPKGEVASTPDEVFNIVDKMNYSAVIKAQVLTGGRGKAGGVKLISSAEEAKAVSAKILKMTIKDNPVHKVLVTPTVDIRKEFYASIVVNRSEKEIDCIICREGGIEIEEIAENTPEKIHKIPVSEKIFEEKKMLLEMLSKIFDANIS
jgi:succinyl-CoA synthetase beta subunit